MKTYQVRLHRWNGEQVRDEVIESAGPGEAAAVSLKRYLGDTGPTQYVPFVASGRAGRFVRDTKDAMSMTAWVA